MEPTALKPLTPALFKLVKACVILKTTNAKTLAGHLNRSPATVRTEFQRILSILDTHSRFSALKIAEEQGWLEPSTEIDRHRECMHMQPCEPISGPPFWKRFDSN